MFFDDGGLLLQALLLSLITRFLVLRNLLLDELALLECLALLCERVARSFAHEGGSAVVVATVERALPHRDVRTVSLVVEASP